MQTKPYKENAVEITLKEILDARENRAKLQKSLLSRGFPIISFSMNIAGPKKTSPSIERAFYEGRRMLEGEISRLGIKYIHEEITPTGCEAMYCVDTDKNLLKDICVQIEEASRLGRLFDFDVIGTDGAKLERKNPRACLICGKAGRECAASRAHSVEELQKETAKIICDYFLLRDAEYFSVLAKDSLLRELYTTPKPGLVDRKNNGSHPDMSLSLFEKSADTLTPYFFDCFTLGANNKEFSLLRKRGIKAEEEMKMATGGKNTHKGAIFCFGVLLYSLGQLWREDAPIPHIDTLLEKCAEVSKSTLCDFCDGKTDTAGKRLFAEKQIKGVRGEASEGFPSVKNISLPQYEKAIENGFSENEAGILALLSLIAEIDDTTLYKRGGEEGVAFARKGATELLSKQKDQIKEISESPNEAISTSQNKATDKKTAVSYLLHGAQELDGEFISRNLSVGGCADLLAVTYFLHTLKNRYNQKRD